MLKKKRKLFYLFIILALLLCWLLFYLSLPYFFSVKYVNFSSNLNKGKVASDTTSAQKEEESQITNPEIQPIVHLSTPESVKAVYLSAWTAGSKKYRDPVVKMIDETELNAVVIDIKDSTGRVSFHMDDPNIIEVGSAENRISDIRELTNLLHQKNIYIIGRISVFQDPFLTKKKPEWAITRKSDGKVWKDRKGLSFLDPTKQEVRDYILSIALNSYQQGFDEINFDYIRYPSDGNMNDINYNLKDGKTRSDNIEGFFIYLSLKMKKDQNIPISADLFGLTTQQKDDMGIGQVWEKVIPYFDFISPMVYPSHYPSGSSGYKNPALYPYEIVNKALTNAVDRTKLANQDIKKIRPWLQDFNLGATYTKEMVRAQMKATYDNGLNSWMLWDASNTYTSGALLLSSPSDIIGVNN